jgi:hypothetical protein
MSPRHLAPPARPLVRVTFLLPAATLAEIKHNVREALRSSRAMGYPHTPDDLLALAALEGTRELAAELYDEALARSLNAGPKRKP